MNYALRPTAGAHQLWKTSENSKQVPEDINEVVFFTEYVNEVVFFTEYVNEVEFFTEDINEVELFAEYSDEYNERLREAVNLSPLFKLPLKEKEIWKKASPDNWSHNSRPPYGQ